MTHELSEDRCCEMREVGGRGDRTKCCPGEPADRPQLVTVDGTRYGPYIGLPVAGADHYGEYLFTRETAQQILNDLHRDECGLTGRFDESGTLTFAWDETYRSESDVQVVRPDSFGRYAIGGLWPWDEWSDDVTDRSGRPDIGEWPWTGGGSGCTCDRGNPASFAAMQRAYALGACEYQQTGTYVLRRCLAEIYDRGREEAHRLTPCRRPAAGGEHVGGPAGGMRAGEHQRCVPPQNQR